MKLFHGDRFCENVRNVLLPGNPNKNNLTSYASIPYEVVLESLLICLVLWCAIGSRAIAIADELSEKTVVGPLVEIPSSESRERTNNTSQVASQAAMYSASAEESAGVRCNRDLQEIGPPRDKT